MTNKPCREELDYLIGLANRMASSMAEPSSQLQQWLDSANKLLRSINEESLQSEMELEKLSLHLRTIWLRYANNISSQYLKSPPHFQMVYLPSGESNPFPYDRWNKPQSLEARAERYRRAPDNWAADHVVFNSGMAAITCALQVTRSVYKPNTGTPLHLHGVGGYFEIMELMRDIHDELFQLRIFTSQQEFLHSVSLDQAQVLYIEPVYTQSGDLQVFNQHEFLQSWHRRSGNVPTTLLLDTTFTGNRFPVQEFLSLLEPRAPRVVIQVSSTLKLDQEGLEFSNAGLMSIYSSSEEIATGIGKRMRKFRATTGLGLTWEQTAALDYPGFLDAELSERHADAVFRNNALLAERLQTGGDLLFTGKSHPSLQHTNTGTHSIAPFVNIFLHPDTGKYDRELLKHALHMESTKRGICFQPGSSFGFRAHRVETSIQAESGFQVIRVAMGSRAGPSLSATIELLNEFSHIKTFSALRARYPKLAEVSRKFVDQS